MLPLNKDHLRDLLIAVCISGAMTLLYALLFAAPAHAQISVEDAVTEKNTFTMTQQLSTTNQQLGNANQHLDTIANQTATIAQSLTTGYGASRYASQLPVLNSLMQTATSGVADADSFAALFQGWKDLGQNFAQTAAQQSTQSLKTFQAAITVALNQADHFAAEDQQFNKLTSCISAQGITAL